MKLDRTEAAGWLGIILIQGASVPVMIRNLMGASTELPPLSMTLLIWSGLALFLYRSVVRADMVAIVSNAAGFILQSVMLALIALPFY